MYFNNCSSSGNISKTFIIEPLEITGGTPTYSACTALYTNQIISCSGDTTISLTSGQTIFNNNIFVNGNISANTIDATTYLSGGTNIIDVITGIDTYVTGATFNDAGDTLTLTRNDDITVIASGITNYYTSGGTLINDTLYFDRNDSLSAYTIDLSGLDVNDTFITGATLSTGGTLTIVRNDDVNIITSGFATDDQIIVLDSLLDIYQTGTTIATGTAYSDVTWTNQVLVGGDYGHTISSSEITFSATGYYNVTYSLSINRLSGGRSNSRARLVLDEGAGYNEIIRSRGYGYHRSVTAGEDTITKIITQKFNVGDKIKVQYRKEVGTGSLVTIPNASNITIVKLTI